VQDGPDSFMKTSGDGRSTEFVIASVFLEIWAQKGAEIDVIYGPLASPGGLARGE
jgi:hypothetical protein